LQVDLSSYQSGDEGQTIGLVQRALILKTFPGFSSLNSAELAVMASVMRERFFPKGAEMHTPGVPVLAFHLMVEGEVEIRRHGVAVDVLGARSSIGGLAALTRDPEGTHAVCLTDAFALEIDTDDMQDVFEDNFNTLIGVLTAMARTVRQFQIAKGSGATVSSDLKLAAVEGDEPLTMVERMFFMRNTSNFNNTSIEALSDLAEGLVEKRYADGDVLWEIGDMGDYSLTILQGKIRCELPEGEPWEFEPGWLVGGLDSFAHEPHWYKATASGDLRVLVMQRTVVLDVLEDHIEMAMELLRNFAAGITKLLEIMATMKKQAANTGAVSDEP
jgi:CRP-like cAMP-binding protein